MVRKQKKKKGHKEKSRREENKRKSTKRMGDDRREETTVSIRCPYCLKTFTTEDSNVGDKLKPRKKPLQCCQCKRLFQYQDQLSISCPRGKMNVIQEDAFTRPFTVSCKIRMEELAKRLASM